VCEAALHAGSALLGQTDRAGRRGSPAGATMEKLVHCGHICRCAFFATGLRRRRGVDVDAAAAGAAMMVARSVVDAPPPAKRPHLAAQRSCFSREALAA